MFRVLQTWSQASLYETRKPRPQLGSRREKVTVPAFTLCQRSNTENRRSETGPLFPDENIEYISLSSAMNGNKVLAACRDQSQSAKEPPKEHVKQTLRRRIEREKKYAILKNIWFGKWEPRKENLVSASSTTTFSMAPK